MRMDLERLKVFYVVAKVGNLVRASAQLHITQPSLSRTIRVLEDELQVQLFERTGKGLKLTAQGERLYDFAQEIVERSKYFEEEFFDNKEQPRGELKIVTTPYMASTWLPPYLKDFINQYPSLKVKLIGTMGEIEVNEADIAIRTYIPHQPHLIQNLCFSFHSNLWASSEYLDKYGVPQRPQDLDNHRLIIYDSSLLSSPLGSASWILNVGATANHQRKPFLEVNSLEGMINFALEGLGIIEMQKEVVQQRQLNLIEILPSFEGPKIDIYYVYSQKIKGSSKIKAFDNYFKKLTSL